MLPLSEPFYIVAGDELPKFGPYVLKYPDGAVINLAGKAVKFRFRRKEGGTGQERNATIVDAAAGKAEYAFIDGDGLEPGWYWAKFHVEDSPGKWLSVPHPEHRILVSDDRTATTAGAPEPEPDDGFTLGTGKTLTERRANLTRLRQLIDDAATNGTRFVELPAGTIEIELQAGDVNSDLNGGIVCVAELTGTLRIRGAGARETVIKFYPTSLQTLNYAGFMIDAVAAAAHVTFEDLTLDGPTTEISTQVTDANAIGFYSSGGLSDTSTVTLERVRILGKWDMATYITAGGKKHVTIRECYFEADNPVSVFYDTPTTAGGTKLHISDSHIKAAYVGYARGTDNNAYCMYVHPSVSMRCVNTIFEGAGGDVGYAVHIFGGPSHLPDYCEFIGCDFLNCKRGVLGNKLVPTRFNNCSFLVESNAILPQNAGTLKGFMFCENCRFKMLPGSGNLGGGVIGGGFYNCNFDDGGGSGIFFDTASGVWHFVNCRFDKTGTGAFHIGAGGEHTIEGCEFYSTAASYAVVTVTGARVRLRDCVFNTNVRGSYGGASAADIDFEGCHFKNAEAVRFSANNPAGSVRGRNNFFDSTTWTTDGGSTGWCQIHPREAANPSTVASAGSVTLSPNYDLHHITGTTTINNIYILDSAPAVILFGGKIRLVADGAFALGAAGNIVAKNGAARAVGELIVLEYDPTTAKWREYL